MLRQENFLREKTCCFTGHRQIPAGELEGIRERLEEIIKELYHRNILYYRAGGAVGFDSLAAEAVLHLREQEEYAKMKLILVLPCHDQTRGWNAADVERYEDIKRKADEVIYVSQEYTRGCMHKRNRRLVDNSSICICYQTKARGGTAYTVHYAEEHKLDIINVA